MSETAFVLIVGADPEKGADVASRLKQGGHACRLANSGQEAAQSIRQRPPDVVVTEYPAGDGVDGREVLAAAKQQSSETEVVLVVAPENEAAARAAMDFEANQAAFDYLLMPASAEAICVKVLRAARKAVAARERRLLTEGGPEAFEFEGMIGRSPVLAKELNRVRKVARAKSTVLIIGETGTGKELVAAAIHQHSPRVGKPFQVINCAAISETLLESELFGHVKGSFTGAVSDKKGILEAADGGTLFLDEIGDMPLSMQAKLLRTLESGEVQRVGSYQTRQVNVRFIAATHRDLVNAVAQGEFREDLLYRLRTQGAIRLPPLRERREDIPLLVHHFIEQANRENGLRVEGIGTEALRKLTNYSWPGNVRELRNVVEGMVIEAEHAMLDMHDLPPGLRTTTDIVPVSAPNFSGMSMAEVERLHIVNTLRQTGGNREKAAGILKISPRTLYRKLREYGLN